MILLLCKAHLIDPAIRSRLDRRTPLPHVHEGVPRVDQLIIELPLLNDVLILILVCVGSGPETLTEHVLMIYGHLLLWSLDPSNRARVCALVHHVLLITPFVIGALRMVGGHNSNFDVVPGLLQSGCRLLA